MSEPARAVFLSYASQDAEAAQRLCEALRAAGIEVWFDRNELVGGDAWDAKIRRQIAECALFVPIISATTQARREGYFRLEWKLAAQRTHMMSDDTPFLLPVVIDDTRDADARVPAEFKAVQWTRLPGGAATPKFGDRVRSMLATGPADQPAASTAVAPGQARATRPAAPGRPGLRIAAALGGVVLVAGGWWLLFGRSPSASSGPSPVATAPASDVARLVERAKQLRTLSGLTRERLGAAEDLLREAARLDPTAPDVLAVSAQIDALMVFRSWDASEERRQAAGQRAARAVALAPDNLEARRAQAMVAAFMLRSTAALQEAAAIYRALLQERPEDVNLLEELGTVLQSLRSFDEAAKLFERAGRPLLAGQVYYASGRFKEALAVAESVLAQGRNAAAFVLKANVELFGFNDLAAAQASVSQLTPTELREDEAAAVALRLAVLSRDAAGLLRLLEPFPHPFVSILGVNYPRRYWTGLAREWQQQPEAARIEWRGALQSLEESLQTNPREARTLSWIAMIHASLRDTEATQRALRLYAEYEDLSGGRWDFNYCIPWLRLGGRDDEVIDRLAKSLRDPVNGRFNYIIYAWARFSPELDSLRGNPRFEQLLRETRPKDALPFPDQGPAAAASPVPPATDEKSVAVLAFANLSDDKANEFFSDGISEELLNVLAQVPGLKVSARTSAFSFKGRNVPVAEIARQLGVAHIVEGSVRKSGEKVRITAKLIKAADGFQVWSDTFTRDLKDIFAVQDEIAGLIADRLALKLGETSPGRVDVDPRAFELYVQARQIWSTRSFADFARAEQMLNQALEISPGFARARVALIDVRQMREFRRRAIGSFGQRQSPELDRFQTEVEQVLAGEPGLAEAYATLGTTLQGRWRWPEAGRAYRRAVELNPNYATGHQWLGMQSALEGRVDEALAALKLATELDPLSSIILDNYGWLLDHVGRHREAIALVDRAQALNAMLSQSAVIKASSLWALGRRDEAVALAGRIQYFDLDEQVRTLLSVGQVKEVWELLERADPDRTVGRFKPLLAAGRREEALEALAADVTAMTFGDCMELLYRPQYDAVRDDPRFLAAMERLGLREAHRRIQTWRAAHPPEKPDVKP